MIRSRFFRKYAIIAVVLTLLFVGLGMLGIFVISEINRTNFEKSWPSMMSIPARLVGLAPAAERSVALKRLLVATRPMMPDDIWLVDATGKILDGSVAGPLPVDWKTQKLPAGDFEIVKFGEKGHPGPPDGIVRLPGSPTQYIIVVHQMPPGLGPPGPKIVFAAIGSIVGAALLATLATLFILVHSLRSKAVMADKVISELQRGNLKARFPITSVDEFGKAMQRFNLMADEIERLVVDVKRIERSRAALLQELAHDLRTPIASIKNLVEVMIVRGDTLTPELKTEFLGLSVKEIEYFERLVEDLLFLAQVVDPHYHETLASIGVLSVVRDELDSAVARNPGKIGNICLEPSASDRTVISGDEHLLRRLLRNALENAFSFATDSVVLTLSVEKSALTIDIQDDGPGFSDEALKAFGERRVTRVLDKSVAGGRLSVGLGSVIMRSVATILRGQILAKNLATSSGNVTGAQLRIILQTSADEPKKA